MRFRIIKEIMETANSKTLLLKAEDDSSNYNFIPGQYCVIDLALDDGSYKRCYSFSMPQKNANEIAITVKKMTPGKVSSYLVDTTMLDRVLTVSKAYGEFTKERFHNEKPLLCLAAGSGITPIFSIINALVREQQSQINLLYFNQSRSDTIYWSQLNELQQTFKHLKIHFFTTREFSEGILKGRLNKELIAQLHPEIKNSNVAVCGPASFMADACDYCHQLGVSREQIFSEDFGNNLVNDGIVTENSDSDMVKVTFACHDKQISVSKNSLLLEIAEDNNIKIPNECCIGSCGECKIKLETGKVDMDHIGGINPVDEKNGFILSCCTRIQGNIVVRTDKS